jgi:hypothetical protein
MAKNRMTFEKTQRENKKRQKAALKRVSRQARKDQAKFPRSDDDTLVDDVGADDEGGPDGDARLDTER